MNKLEMKKPLIALILFTLLTPLSLAQDSIIVGSQAISLDAYPGRRAETKIRVVNNLDFTVVFVAARTEGDIREIIGLENTRISLESGEESELPIKFYVLPQAQERTYNGDIVISTGAIVRKVPITLTVLSAEELFKARMSVESFTENVAPGGVLSVVADIVNLGEGTIGVIVDVSVRDPDTGRILGHSNQSVLVATEKSSVLKILLPDDIKQKKYLIDAKLYTAKTGRDGSEITSATGEVNVVFPLLESLSMWAAERLRPSRIKTFLSIILAIIIISPLIIQYRLDQERKRRYIESLDFQSLPRPGRNTAYIGRVAETTLQAYIPLDDLMAHTLVAGATGSGKTIAAQILVEEALAKERSIIVFDPTAQWTGFIKACNTRGMIKLYSRFKMKKAQSRSFNGNIHIVENPHKRIDLKRYMKPGEITIFCLHKLTSTQMDLFVENTVKNVFMENMEESTKVKTLVVYDEVHRLLPKFGGSGRGFIHLERAAREYRKWGIGLVLISQVLSDFVGEIKANIGTEIQMRTRYEKDLQRIKLKYDKDTMRSVVKESVGTGMIQNAEYNQGRPYFISFRPVLHDHHKLADKALEKYDKYNNQINELYDTIQKYTVVGCDMFDLELELNLASENLKRGLFDVVDLYVKSVEPKVREYYNTLSEKQKNDFNELEEKDERFIERSRKTEEKIEAEVESLALLKKEEKDDSYWKQKLEDERKKVEDELTEQREEMSLIMERLEKIRKVVRDKEEVKARLERIRGDVEGVGTGKAGADGDEPGENVSGGEVEDGQEKQD